MEEANNSSAEEAAFVADDVSNIIKESIDAVLQNQQYIEAKVCALSVFLLMGRGPIGILLY